MATLLLTFLVLLINSAICYNLRRTCPTIPVKTRLPFQCENINGDGIAICDANGNYPYLLTCQADVKGSMQSNTFERFNNSCQGPYTNAICCNQVIKHWNFKYRDHGCNDNYQITGCYPGYIDYKNNQCEMDDSNLRPYASCHQLPSNQILQCNVIENTNITNKSVPCPGHNYTMIYCDSGIVTFDEDPLGLCNDDYDFAQCCAVYKSEPYDSNPKYVTKASEQVVPAAAAEYCWNEFKTYGASIHTQADFEEAYQLCKSIPGVTTCCLGGSTYLEGVWKWDDGSGTFPPGLEWDKGGLWENGQPNNPQSEDFACLIPHVGGYGINDCQNNPIFSCYPLCNYQNESSNESRRRLQSNVLDETCFEIEITLDVENILPDPSYILPQANSNAIKNALQQILLDNNINGFDISIGSTFNDVQQRRRMQDVDWFNECPQQEDNSITKFYFDSFPYNILCDSQILNIPGTADGSMDLQWQCTCNESSIVYIWNIESVSCLIKTSCPGIDMQVSIMDINNSLIGLSDLKDFEYDGASDFRIQNFTFSENIILYSNTTYLLNMNIKPHDDPKISCMGGEFVFEQVDITPIIYTIAEPSSCKLGSHLAVDKSIKFGLGSFCNPNANETRESFEIMLYNQHTSDQIIEGWKWASLPESINNNRRTLRRLSKSRGGGTQDDTGLNKTSLHIVWQNGTSGLLANDTVFPDYDQCVAVDDDTFRVFSVGGQINGKAIDRLKVYEITSQSSAELINDEKYMNLTLDKPRFAAMCYFYKNKYDDKEYIIIINGMNDVNDMGNNSNWYNDIVFIPLDENERNNGQFPKIKLKYNVIDMRAFITETNELYLFGGRNSINATNYIQVIDLNEVFNGSSNDTLMTYDRMEHMQTNRVIPFVDFPKLKNETCIMIIGGQDYINGQWIDTQVPLLGLQLYCNDILVAYLENTRRRLQNRNISRNNNEFTQFDEDNLQQSYNNETIANDSISIIITEYNFTNDDILYEFTASFQICFDKINEFKNALNLLNNIGSNNNDFTQNILTESQKHYRGWSFGFGDVDILDMNIIMFNGTVSPTDIPTNEPSVQPSITSNTPTITPSKTIITNITENEPTNKPSTKPPLPISLVLIIIFSVVGVIIISVIIWFIIWKIRKNQNPYIRTPFDTDDDTDLEEL